MPRPWPKPRPSMVIVAPSGTSTGSSAIAGAAVATTAVRTVTVAAASRPSMGPPEKLASDVVQPASGLRDRAAHRRVHGKRLGKLVGRQRLRDRDRHRVDELAGPRSDDHAADDDAGAGAAQQLHEAVTDALHLGARVARQR